LHGFGELMRGEVHPDDGPQRRLPELLLCGRREPSGAAQCAREFVDGRMAVVRVQRGRALRDGGELTRDGRCCARRVGHVERLRQRDAEREHFRAHRERLTLEQLRRGVARREALGGRTAFAPRRRESEIDERHHAARLDDDVRGLHVTVQEPCAMQQRQLIRRPRERREQPLERCTRDEQRVEAPALHQLAQHERPLAARQPPETHDARHSQALEARERHGLAHQRGKLAGPGVRCQQLQRELSA
jgi:hypothetical protein